MLRNAPRLRRGALLIRGPYYLFAFLVGPGSAEQRNSAAPRPGHERRSSRRGEVHGSFRERRQALIGSLLLLQGLIQQPNGVLHAELLRPLLQRAIARDFVVLDG